MRALGDIRRKNPVEAPKPAATSEQPVQEPAQEPQSSDSFDESVVFD
jgi:hypothetical protein